jgi:hypothetical protein
MKSVNINDLETSFLKVIESIKELKGENFQLELGQDYYWNIGDDDLYRVEKKPGNLDIGSLYSDVEQIERIAKSETSAVPYNIKLFSAMLKYMASKV